MTKYLSVVFLFCLISCATSSKKNFQIKRIPAADKAQARSIIQNHVNFLHMLFEQSKDPYYHVEKWTAECLSENKIGKVTESEGLLQSVSELYLSQSHEVGQCSKSVGTYQAYVVYVYCEKRKEVLEIKYPTQNQKYSKVTSECD